MKFKTYQESKMWTDTQPTAADPTAVEAAKRAKEQLESVLSSVLLSENLVILTGLGTSMCIKDSAGNSVAPTMSDLWGKTKSSTKDFDGVLAAVHHPRESTGSWKEDIETLLSRCQMSIELEDNATIREFIAKTEDLIVKSCSFLNLLPAGSGLSTHEAFLRKIARRPVRFQRTKLFTTNYDLCFETAAGASGFVVIDGFSHTSPQEFDGMHFGYDIVRRDPETEVPSYIPNVIQLLKLHGSVDWDRLPTGQIQRAIDPKRPVIIYPRNAKFESSYNQPYFEMMSRFQSALRLPNTGLLIIGFGFNDAHLVGPLNSALRSNTSLRLVAVAPSYETKRPAFIQSLHSLIEAGDRRLALLATGFEELVAHIPDLKAPSEEEQHISRLKQVP
jgi:SIR2-like domain